MTTCKSCIVLMSFLVLLSGAPLDENMTRKIQTEAQAKQFLSQFGYLKPINKNQGSENIMFEDPTTTALKKFQSFFGLNPTGNLDTETLDYMNKPRCGKPDDIQSVQNSDLNNYELAGSRWPSNELTYTISKYSKQLDKRQTDLVMRRAFDVWSSVTPLTFIQLKYADSSRVAIDIRFETGDHSINSDPPFDGPNGVLAHATSPSYGGSFAHFDDLEQWSIDTNYGDNAINLFQVAAHEFGHALGLLHSGVKSALMWPTYNPHFNLDTDDVKAIQALYGTRSGKKTDHGNNAPDYYTSPNYNNDGELGEITTMRESGEITKTTTTSTTTTTTTTTTTSTTTTTKPPKDPVEDSDAQLCTVTKIDTLFNSAVGETFVFKGDYYWKLIDGGVARGFPKPIAGTWSDLPGNIDAAFTYKNDKTYFFKGTKYWRYTETTMDDGYPKFIADGFPGIPDNVDAALFWSGNGMIYFFKETYYWKVNLKKNIFAVKVGYPKLISKIWRGIPNNIDAVFRYMDGKLYFFKDNYYYKLNFYTSKVVKENPPYPRNARNSWFGCNACSACNEP
ncbi:hypothetical protein ACI65C_012506 [Semiaphis heraclei]